MPKTRFFIIVLLELISITAHALGNSIESQREEFIRIEKNIAAMKSGEFPIQAEALHEYPLYPVLRYHWLRKNLHRNHDLSQFIIHYEDTLYARSLQRDRLQYLAATKQWHEFIKHYKDTGNNAQRCQYRWAQFNVGLRNEALLAAIQLWTVGHSQPKACDALLTELLRSKYFTEDMVWQRFELALRNNKVGLAQYVKKLLPETEQAAAEFWLKVHKNPRLIVEPGQQGQNMPLRALIFAHAIDRWAGLDVEEALAIWEQYQKTFQISLTLTQRIERRLGLELAFKKNEKAYTHLSMIQKPDSTVREWRIRAALLEGNWHHVKQSLNLLSSQEKLQPRWQYWLARAQYETGAKQEAVKNFKKLAEDRSLFGFLAADRMHKQPQLSNHPIALTQEELARFSQLPAVKMVSEFSALGRDREAKRQWWFLVGRLSKAQLLVAAKLAQQWSWTQVAIFTVAKADHWDDVDLRFPMNYMADVNKYANQQELDPAIVLGLIRRESVFDSSAQSPAGARGLMQIMPRTGQQIARFLNEKWISVAHLYNPEVNVKYGSFYYKQMLDRFDGHFAMAAAAYNAGPGRVEKWRPKYKPIAADVWIETIPFKETREYVNAVLGYAIIYQQRLDRSSLKIRDIMRDIFPN